MVEQAILLLKDWDKKVNPMDIERLCIIESIADLIEPEISKTSYSELNITGYITLCSLLSKHELMGTGTLSSDLGNSLQLNTACLRLLLCLSKSYTEWLYYPFIEEEIIKTLVQWTTDAPEPLQSYSTGLLVVYLSYYKQNSSFDESSSSSGFDFNSFEPVNEELLKCLMERLVRNHDPLKYQAHLTWQLLPMSEVTKQTFLFEFLEMFCKKENYLQMFIDSKLFPVLVDCLDASKNYPNCLMISAMSYLKILLNVENFAKMFIDDDNAMEFLLRHTSEPLVPSMMYCLREFGMDEQVIEYMCETRPHIVQDIIMFLLNYYDDSENSMRLCTIVFLGFVFRNKAMLEFFDANGGLQTVLKFHNDLTEMSRIKYEFFAYKNYIQSHFIIKYNELTNTPFTTLKVTDQELMKMIDDVVQFCPLNWELMEKVADGFLTTLDYKLFLGSNFFHLQFFVDVLCIFSLMPNAQMLLCKQNVSEGRVTSPMQDLLFVIEDYTEPNPGWEFINKYKITGLRTIVNCVTAPEIQNDNNSLLKTVFTRLREVHGLMSLMNLMNPDIKLSDEVGLLAMKALTGMARDDTIRNIICKMKNMREYIDYANAMLPHVQPTEEAPVQPLRMNKHILACLTGRQLGTEKILAKDFEKLYNFKNSCLVRYFPLCTSSRHFSCIKFLSHENIVVICDNNLIVWRYDTTNGDLKDCMTLNFACEFIQEHRSGHLLLTSGYVSSSLRSTNDFKTSIYEFGGYKFAELSNWSNDRILASNQKDAQIIDINTGIPIQKLIARYKNDYHYCKATYSMDDRQVLYDGVLFAGEIPIFKFDKLNTISNGIFHPNGYEIIMNTEIWDVRTRKLVRTVPVLHRKKITFGPTSNIMYVAPWKNVASKRLEVLDSASYKGISCIKTVGDLGTFDINSKNNMFALSETHDQPTSLTCYAKICHV